MQNLKLLPNACLLLRLDLKLHAFEALPLRMLARTVAPTPGTTLQLKAQSNLEKSLGSCFDIQIDQKMGGGEGGGGLSKPAC